MLNAINRFLSLFGYEIRPIDNEPLSLARAFKDKEFRKEYYALENSIREKTIIQYRADSEAAMPNSIQQITTH